MTGFFCLCAKTLIYLIANSEQFVRIFSIGAIITGIRARFHYYMT